MNLAMQGINDHFKKQLDLVAEEQRTKHINVIVLPETEHRFIQYSKGRYAITSDDYKIFAWDEHMSGRSREQGEEW